MSDSYGRWGPGDDHGEPDADATPADGTYVDWAHATHLTPTEPVAAEAAPADAAAPAAGRRSLRDLANELVWRYRNAPLATRVTIDLVGLGLVLLLSAGGMFLLLRDRGGPDLAASPAGSEDRVASATTEPPTTDPPASAASTTTTSTTTSTSTTTTSTTTTSPPTTAPSTTAPPTTAGPTTAPPTTEGPPPQYENCWEAERAGALPLYEGDPGYRGRLDRDGDGQACNSRRDWR
jgi:hypothetical protein